MALKNLFNDDNNINEKNVVGFLSFSVMVIFAVVDIVTGSYGQELQIQVASYRNLLTKILLYGNFINDWLLGQQTD